MREKLVRLTAGFLGRCGLDASEADELVSFAEWKHHTAITYSIGSSIVETIIAEVKKETQDCYNSSAYVDERVAENFRNLAVTEKEQA